MGIIEKIGVVVTTVTGIVGLIEGVRRISVKKYVFSCRSNGWHQDGSLKKWCFHRTYTVPLEKGEEFKLCIPPKGPWFGFECLSTDLKGCFGSAPDGYGGENIRVEKGGTYRIRMSKDQQIVIDAE